MSLRSKQALILLVATVLPFGLGGAAVHFVVAPAYRRTVLQFRQEATERLSDQIALGLSRDTAQLQRLAAMPSVKELVGRRKGAGSAQRSVSSELRWWQQANPGINTLVVTDLAGRALASSAPLPRSDYRSAPWWRTAFHSGKGRVSITQGGLRNAGTGADPMAAISVPIYAQGRPGSMLVGVLMGEVRVGTLVEQAFPSGVGRTEALTLVGPAGKVLYSSERGTPAGGVLPVSAQRRLMQRTSGVRMEQRPEGERLVAWSAVGLQDVLDHGAWSPRLHVMTSSDPETHLGTLHQVQRWMLVIAVITILVAVGLGHWLADWMIARPVRSIAAGMRELARGDFTAAARIAEELCRMERGANNGEPPVKYRKRADAR